MPKDKKGQGGLEHFKSPSAGWHSGVDVVSGDAFFDFP